MGTHRRKHRPHHPVRTEHVGVHQPMGQLGVDVLQRTLDAEARVVDEYIDPPRIGQHRIHRTLNAGCIGHVHAHHGEGVL